MDPQLRNFVRDLLHQGIRGAIHAIFWRMPTLLILLLLAILIGVVIYFRMY